MSDDATRTRVELGDNMLTTWCAQTHDLREIELTRLTGTRYRVGDCPLCDRRYESRITSMGYEKM